MLFLNNLSEFAGLLLSLLTVPFTLSVLVLSIPIYLLLARHERRQRIQIQKRQEQAVIEARDQKTAARPRTYPTAPAQTTRPRKSSRRVRTFRGA